MNKIVPLLVQTLKRANFSGSWKVRVHAYWRTQPISSYSLPLSYFNLQSVLKGKSRILITHKEKYVILHREVHTHVHIYYMLLCNVLVQLRRAHLLTRKIVSISKSIDHGSITLNIFPIWYPARYILV